MNLYPNSFSLYISKSSGIIACVIKGSLFSFSSFVSSFNSATWNSKPEYRKLQQKHSSKSTTPKSQFSSKVLANEIPIEIIQEFFGVNCQEKTVTPTCKPIRELIRDWGEHKSSTLKYSQHIFYRKEKYRCPKLFFIIAHTKAAVLWL